MDHHDIHEQRGSRRGPDDAALLVAVSRLWHQVDPPPTDLADGVLARLAAEELEFDLLTLVESGDALAGVRSGADRDQYTDEEVRSERSGSWSLEYAGEDFKVYLGLTRIEERTRVDGWVVPARPLTVRLRTRDGEQAQTHVDEHGRFEFSEAPTGRAHLAFVDETSSADRSRVTPPFWI